jgi:phosphatidylserine decarboxylase
VRIHREGYGLIALAGGILSVLIVASRRFLPNAFPFAVVIGAVIFTFFLQFFRNPQRRSPTCDGCIVSPADGTIMAVERVHEPEYFRDERVKISIFMSVTNVHLNWVPTNGKVVYYRYHPGQYLVAFHPKSSELNERNTIVIETETGQKILVRQIAGILARRIRCYIGENQLVSTGQELGFIRFGSRCDVFLPLGARIKVKIDQKVTGGETILAEL